MDTGDKIIGYDEGNDQKVLRQLFDDGPIGIAIISMDTKERIYANKCMAKMFGAESVEELVQHDIAESWVDAERLKHTRELFESGQELVDFEAERIRLDGSRFWILLNSQQIEFEGRRVRVIWQNDITNRKAAEAETLKGREELEARVSERTRDLTSEIAERERSEQALRESEEQFRGMFETSPIGVALHTVGGAYVRVNRAFCDILGYFEDELEHMNWRDVTHPDDIAPTELLDQDVSDGIRSSFVIEKRYIHKQGHTIWARVASAVLHDHTGAEQYILGQVYDISAIKKAEEVARESHKRFKDFAEIATDWFWETDADLRFTYVSDGYYQITGRGPDYIIGKTPRELRESYDPEFDKKTEDYLNSLDNHEETEGYVFKVNHIDGRVRVLKTNGRPVYDDNGTFAGYRGTGVDATLEVEMDRSTRLLREAIETFPDSVVLIDPDENVVFTNDRYHEIYPNSPSKDEISRYNLETLLRRSLQNGQISDPQAKSDPEGWLAKTLNEFRTMGSGEGETVHETGRVYHYKFVRTTEGGQITVHTDITDLKLIERELESQRDELKKINDQKDRFFAIVAHDLRSPFNGLLGFSEILSNSAENMDRADIVKYATYTHRAADAAYKLLEDLLDWSRLQLDRMGYEPELVDLEELINSNQARFQSIADEKGVTLQASFEGKSEVSADRKLIETILRNLVSNAVKFTPKGGTVSVDANSGNQNLVISVADTGVGIAKDRIGDLFTLGEKISTLGTEGEDGTGLGLQLCKELAEKQGGDITVESVEGEGTTVQVSLPLRP